jgi:hypothetical protein
MKQLHLPRKNNRAKQIACTVSAAALMLGVSHATTVAMHFQVNYCGYVGYTGFPVTAAAFGVQPSGWQNLTQMMSGYAGSGPCALGSPYFYSLSETVSTNTSSGGLNPLPRGTINLTWSANTANFSDFGGYADANNSPAYNINVNYPYAILTGDGEEEVYASFLRDGVNFGPPGGADNTSAPGYSVDITGVKSVFTTTPYVVELIASSDSMQVLTNAFVIDVTNSISNSVTYPNTAPVVSDAGGAPWLRGHGGGLSTASATMNVDHLQIVSAKPAHGGTGAPPASYDMAGTISGFIITDQPVVTMSPNSVYCNPGDSVALSSYAIGVTPLHYQWRRNGVPIPGANATNFSIATVNFNTAGFYDVVVTNAYGSATSKAANVADVLLTSANNLVVDSNPANPEHDGLNNGAAWLASSSDGSITRNGVMQFVGTNTNSITVIGTTNFDTATGSMMFWMRSAGTDPNAAGTIGAAVFGQPGSSFANEFALIQTDGGNMLFNAPAGNQIISVKNISDNDWHLIIVTYDSSVSGGASLYIDGVLDTTNANSAAWTPPVGQPLQAGFSSGGGVRAYTGLLNDVRVYSRELTSAEVATIYSNGSLIDTSKLQMQLSFSTAPVTGLVLNWPAPGSYTTTLQSSLSVNGTYTNVPAASLPYYVVPKANQRYFRYLISPSITPQARVSNPYLM